MKRGVKILLLLLGLSLFAWFVHRAGARGIFATFQQLGWWLPVVLLPYMVVYALDTLGWRFTFEPGSRRPPFLTLLRLRWAGEAVNNVIPTGYIGGEAVKAWLLHRRGVPLVAATTSVVISKTVQVAAQVVFIALGAWIAFLHLPAGSPGRNGMAVVAALSLVAILLLFWIQSRGLFQFLHIVATRLRIHWLAKNEAKLRELDDKIFQFYHRRPWAFAASGAAYLAGWICDSLEVLLVSHLLGFPMDFSTALAIESFISVAKALGILVPGALGVQESGVWLLFRLFGFGETEALAYAFLRRGREVIFASVGAMLLYAEGGTLRNLGARVEAAIHPTS
jgi:putative membrane protein